MRETDSWPLIQARDFGPKRTEDVRLIVIHTPEFPEVATSAEDIGRYFQHPDKPSSAHVGVDSDSIVQYVKDSYIAYGAPGANHDGIQVELHGDASQTKAQWLDKYSIAGLALGASVVAQYCLKYGLSPIKLTDAELLAGNHGIVGHDQVSRVYRRSDHMDPGPNFPWKRFLAEVYNLYYEYKAL